ncbi:MAG: hypothetical protein Q9209_001167 [Squamulea sp. 1 TL-2023]
MVKNSDEPGPLYQSRYPVPATHASRRVFGAGYQSPQALNETSSQIGQDVSTPRGPQFKSTKLHDDPIAFNAAQGLSFSEKHAARSPPPAPPPTETLHGETPASIGNNQFVDKPNILIRFCRVCKAILMASWVNALLVFVPVAIACEIAHVSPTIIFAMNAIAIIPLAGLLSYATESVASEMGNTIGALMNVSFGNAVELIIFIALVKYSDPDECLPAQLKCDEPVTPGKGVSTSAFGPILTPIQSGCYMKAHSVADSIPRLLHRERKGGRSRTKGQPRNKHRKSS